MHKKVFSATRFHTRTQNNFTVDNKNKSVHIGARDGVGQRGILIGRMLEQGRTSSVLDYGVSLDVAFPHVIGIFGSRGSGKSFDLGVLLEGIMGLGEHPAAVTPSDSAIVFDVQDQFWTLGYAPSETVEADQSHLADLSRWGLEPSHVQGLKVFVPAGSDTQVPNAISFSLASEQLAPADWLAILELDRFSAMGQALLTLLNDLGSMPPKTLADHCIPGATLSAFQPGTVDGLRWRLESLAGTRIIAATGIAIDTLLSPASLSVILMRNLSEAVRSLVVGVITRLVADRMGRVQQARKVGMRTGAAISATDITKRLWLVLDEAHVLVPSDGTTAATVPIVDYVKRGRDAGLSMIFATQQPSAVDSRLMSQVDLTLTHMLGFDADLSAAVARMPTRTAVDYEVDNEKASSLIDVIRSLGPGEAMVADNASGRVFVARIRPRISAHGGATPK